MAHTTWFFETFVLAKQQPDYRLFHPLYGYLFNSYYESEGAHLARPQRGSLSRPTVAEVMAYRAHVDESMRRMLKEPLEPAVAALVELGMQHEQQHQELLITDIKYILGHNPLHPAYDPLGIGPQDVTAEHDGTCPPLDDWLSVEGQTIRMGHQGPGFAFDNESPSHLALIQGVDIRVALVTNDEYLQFMRDGGYQRHSLWHAEGWDWVQTLKFRAPMYWQPDPNQPDGWGHYTLQGGDAADQSGTSHACQLLRGTRFLRLGGVAIAHRVRVGSSGKPVRLGASMGMDAQRLSALSRFCPQRGRSGEYNGKFMVNQQVLRGASWATSPGHARLTYRNFFHAPLRWQFTGIRPVRSRESA